MLRAEDYWSQSRVSAHAVRAEDTRPTRAKCSRRRLLALALTAIAVMETSWVGVVYQTEVARLRVVVVEPIWADDPDMDIITMRAYHGPGIQQPPTHPAAAASLHDDEEVLGIVAGGRSRAYRVSAMARGPEEHIVNDVLAEVPITVTYCDISRCSRAFTGPERGVSLDVRQGGLYMRDKSGVGERRMMLEIGGTNFFQDSGQPVEPRPGLSALPYPDYPLVRTTWGAWKQSHPETDVYEGDPTSREAA
jgi:hypothetical protein